MNSRNISKNVRTKYFEKLKSDYFLRKMFDFLNRGKTLEIIKYNKKIQNRLNININDYIKYSQLYSSIVIELKLVNGQSGKFINIPNKEREYYHIYFDNSNEEIERKYIKYDDKVNLIKIIIKHQITSFKELFRSCLCINSISFKQFIRINITNMSGMFLECSSIKK